LLFDCFLSNKWALWLVIYERSPIFVAQPNGALVLKIRTYSLLLFCWWSSCMLWGQQTPNPFELTARLDNAPLVDTLSKTTEPSKTTILPPPSNSPEISDSPNVTETNPFDLQRDGAAETKESEEAPQPAEEAEETPPTTELEPLPEARAPSSPAKTNASLLFGVILGLGILLSLLFILFRSSFSQSVRSVFNENMLNKLYRDQGATVFSPLTVWYIFAWISGGVFTFLLLQYFEIGITGHFGRDVLYCVLGVSALLFAKHFVLNFLGIVFPIDREMSKYNFTIMLFGIVTGVLLLIPTILLAYGPPSIQQYVVWGALGFVGFMALFLYLRGLFLTNRFVRFHLFHFLLYICTVEIAPIFILVKLSSRYWGG